ncbi:A24 family peptidase [Sphingomonas sp. ID0503]|uniref:A24 family peptidase n=1 Tax=Sphingomonas sp. ID0503 TaxID=3399691 RepID=UPI003AFA98FE
MRELAPALLLVLLALALLTAAATDLRARRIPNWLTAAIALTAPLFWLASGIDLWPGMAIQLAVAVGVFCLFAIAFAYRLMGGGDVKLLGALALWLPLASVPPLLMLTGILGGVLTLFMLAWRWLRANHAIEVPYGVAITAAGLWVIGEPYLYHSYP